jgi:hypothetical protein
MQRLEVEKIFEKIKESILQGLHATENPIAILLGGQPASDRNKN